jgi:hypothetical protein
VQVVEQQLTLIEPDERWFKLGVGPLMLANVHWLDKPNDKHVTVRKASGSDGRYPGFVGADLAIGVMIEARFWNFIGIELDVLRQDDHGTGVIQVKDGGSLCLLPSVNIAHGTTAYDVTIGQSAWHIPLLLKLTIPGRLVTVVDRDDREAATTNDNADDRLDDNGSSTHQPRQNRRVRPHIVVERRIRKWFLGFGFGPELVFPGTASLAVAPGGLDFPMHAKASNYVMYTGSVGFERRLSSRYDIRFLVSLRGSYNPGPGESAMTRGEYDLVGGRIVPITYKSEWRYQAAMTLGASWYF